MKIANNATIEMEYVLSDAEGNILENTDGNTIKYIHGQNMMLPAVEAAMEGKVAGESVSVSLEAKDCYGEYNKDLIMEVPIANFGGKDVVTVGDEFQTHDATGQPVVVVVKEVSDEVVTIDANHPYAGKDITFSITVKEVKETTEEDLKAFWGQAEGGCGCGDGGCGSHSHDEDHECCGGSAKKESGCAEDGGCCGGSH